MKGKALAVHDFLEVLEDLAAILQKAGFQVLSTTDPLCAVDLLNRYGPDLLVTRMHFGNGRLDGGTLARMAKLRRNQTAVVVVVHDEAEEMAVSSGEIVRAPFSKADIGFAALRTMADARKPVSGPDDPDRSRFDRHLTAIEGVTGASM